MNKEPIKITRIEDFRKLKVGERVTLPNEIQGTYVGMGWINSCSPTYPGNIILNCEIVVRPRENNEMLTIAYLIPEDGNIYSERMSRLENPVNETIKEKYPRWGRFSKLIN